jgi:hypothetical protein
MAVDIKTNDTYKIDKNSNTINIYNNFLHKNPTDALIQVYVSLYPPETPLHISALKG